MFVPRPQGRLHVGQKAAGLQLRDLPTDSRVVLVASVTARLSRAKTNCHRAATCSHCDLNKH